MEQDSQHLKHSTEYALAGLKGAFLANGGAIIALLTFVGNKNAVIEDATLWWSFLWFSLGLGAILVAHVMGFLAQSMHMNEGADSYRRGERLAWAGLIFAILSIVFFVVGAFCALDAIT